MSAVPSSKSAAPPGRPSLALAAMGVSSFMVTLDATVLNVALPTIRSDLGADLSLLQWIASAYTLVFASGLLTAGALSDRLGAKRVFLGALGFFTAASVACGLATDPLVLIAARAIQGLGAAAILPSSMALLVDAYPDPIRRTRAIGVWSTISATALVLGPLLGGVLVETLGWRSIFLANLPVGLLALAAAVMSVGTPATHRRGVDLLGQTLAATTLVAVTFSAIEGRELGWTAPAVLAAAILGLAAGLLFLVVERRQDDPMLPLGLFASRGFSTAILTAFFYNLAYYGALFVLSLALQAEGAAPARVGLLFLPMTVATAVMAFVQARIAARVGSRLPIAVGMALGATGAIILIVAGLGPISMAIGGCLIGVGGASLPPIVAAALANVPHGRTGVGSGVLNAARQSGGALGVAILGSLLGGTEALGAKVSIGAIAAAFAAGSLIALIGLRPVTS